MELLIPGWVHANKISQGVWQQFPYSFLPDYMSACRRQQKKRINGEKQIVELPKNVDTWAAGMLLIFPHIVLTDN